MILTMNLCETEADYWRVRNFLRAVFLLNDRLEHAWNVARLDYWRWPIILNCRFCDSVESVTTLWETETGEIIAVKVPDDFGQ